MTIKHICRNCKHWADDKDGIYSVERMIVPRNQGGQFGMTREDAIKYVTESRATTTYSWGCAVIMATVEIEIDQGGGWDSGGASVESIGVSGDFGCIKFEPVDFGS